MLSLLSPFLLLLLPADLPMLLLLPAGLLLLLLCSHLVCPLQPAWLQLFLLLCPLLCALVLRVVALLRWRRVARDGAVGTRAVGFWAVTLAPQPTEAGSCGAHRCVQQGGGNVCPTAVSLF